MAELVYFIGNRADGLRLAFRKLRNAVVRAREQGYVVVAFMEQIGYEVPIRWGEDGWSLGDFLSNVPEEIVRRVMADALAISDKKSRVCEPD